ncbi:MAG: hypothetical protein HRT47_11075 [Candidatus Caenarcaniphilales bacterium]|nr:hypothetical protein [Candidatus Caenarcaniphilales bacterium]
MEIRTQINSLLILVLLSLCSVNKVQAYCCRSKNYDYQTKNLVIRKTRDDKPVTNIKFGAGHKLRANLLYAPLFCKENKNDHRCSNVYKRNFIFDTLDVYNASMNLLKSYNIQEIETSNLADDLQFFNKYRDVNLNRVYGDFDSIDSEELKQVLNHETFYAKLNYRRWDADDTRAFYLNDNKGTLTGATFCLNSELEYENCNVNKEKREIKLGARAYYGVPMFSRISNIYSATVIKVLAPPADLIALPFRLTLGQFACSVGAGNCYGDYYYQFTNYAYNEADLD